MRKKLILLFLLFGSIFLIKGTMGLSSVKEVSVKTDANGNAYVKYQTVAYPIPEVYAFDGNDSVKIIHNDKSGCLVKGKPNTEIKITFK